MYFPKQLFYNHKHIITQTDTQYIHVSVWALHTEKPTHWPLVCGLIWVLVHLFVMVCSFRIRLYNISWFILERHYWYPSWCVHRRLGPPRVQHEGSDLLLNLEICLWEISMIRYRQKCEQVTFCSIKCNFKIYFAIQCTL